MIRLEQLPLEPSRSTSDSPSEPVDFDVNEAYRHFGKQLYLFALNAVGEAESAEEITQETFIRAWKARHRFDPTLSSARTWLFAIARNIVKDTFRSRARLPEPIEDHRITHLPTAGGDPASKLILVEALACLSKEHRQAVVAIHLLGLSYAELSESTDIPVSTLRSRTFHGLRALRRHITPAEADND